MDGHLELVKQVLGAMLEGDVDRARPLVADDFVWHVPGTSSISGDARGVDAWGEKLQRLVRAGLRPEVQDLLGGSGHVAVLLRNTAEADGHALDVRVVNLFTVGDGKVQRLDTFFSEQPAVEDFWNAVLP